jgi:hypothetical protein
MQKLTSLRKVIEDVPDFIYRGNIISELSKNMDSKLQSHSKINGIVKIYLGTQMSVDKYYAYIKSHRK